MAEGLDDSSLKPIAQSQANTVLPMLVPLNRYYSQLYQLYHFSSNTTGFHKVISPISSTPYLASMLNGAAEMAETSSQPEMDNADFCAITHSSTVARPNQLPRPPRFRRHPVWRYFIDMDLNVSQKEDVRKYG